MSKLKQDEQTLHDNHAHKAELFLLIITTLAIFFMACWLYLLFYIRSTDKHRHKLATTDELSGLFNLFGSNSSKLCFVQT